jgi:hypothetical protein
VLAADGVALIVAPSRHGTFDKFERLARNDSAFAVEQADDYSDKISALRAAMAGDPRYDDGLHFPKLLKLRKIV